MGQLQTYFQRTTQQQSTPKKNGGGIFLAARNYKELPVHEYLSHLPDYLTKEEIETFCIDINKLSKLPEDLEINFPNLKELSAGGNLLTNIYPLPTTLTILQLGCNKLEGADLSSLSQLVNLQELLISSNELTTIPNLKSLSSLIKLNISENRISSIDILIENLPSSLKKIEMASNQFGGQTDFAKFVETFPNLEIININENSIENIDPFNGFNHLISLQMNSNLIRNFPVNFEKVWSKMNQLYFDFNLISNFPIQITNLTSLKDIQFSGNPFILNYHEEYHSPSNNNNNNNNVININENLNQRDIFYSSIEKFKENINQSYLDYTNINEYIDPIDFAEIRVIINNLSNLIEENFLKVSEKHFSHIKKQTIYQRAFFDMILPQGLFLGDYQSARNLPILQIFGITHIISVCELPTPYPNQFQYFRVPIRDADAERIFNHFEECYQFINNALSSGGKVLVHCRAGVSRSASVVISFMMKHFKLRMEKAFDHVRTCRSCVGPNNGFMFQLREWEVTFLPPRSDDDELIVDSSE